MGGRQRPDTHPGVPERPAIDRLFEGGADPAQLGADAVTETTDAPDARVDDGEGS